MYIHTCTVGVLYVPLYCTMCHSLISGWDTPAASINDHHVIQAYLNVQLLKMVDRHELHTACTCRVPWTPPTHLYFLFLERTLYVRMHTSNVPNHFLPHKLSLRVILSTVVCLTCQRVYRLFLLCLLSVWAWRCPALLRRPGRPWLMATVWWLGCRRQERSGGRI